MRTIKNTTFLLLLLLCSLALLGCSQKSDENESISEVKAEAEKMDANQLRSMAMKYKEAIEAKNGEVEKLLAKLKDIPPAEMMDAKVKETTDEINKISQSIMALNEKFMIYYNKLKEKGVDTSDLEI
jgi:outer membrane lipoprotein-sorting protein